MQSYDIYAELKHTNNILMELPSFRQMLDENLVLAERSKSLKIAIEYLESKNRRLSKKAAKYNNKSCKIIICYETMQYICNNCSPY